MAKSVEVEGIDRLVRRLKAAGVEVADLKAALKSAAEIVEQTAATMAPRESGALLSSLRSSATKKAGVIRAGNKSAPYAGPIHWGWPARGIKAQPFIQKAATNREPAWLDVMNKHVDSVLDSIGD